MHLAHHDAMSDSARGLSTVKYFNFSLGGLEKGRLSMHGWHGAGQFPGATNNSRRAEGGARVRHSLALGRFFISA